jgi:hypothetical protein
MSSKIKYLVRLVRAEFDFDADTIAIVEKLCQTIGFDRLLNLIASQSDELYELFEENAPAIFNILVSLPTSKDKVFENEDPFKSRHESFVYSNDLDSELTAKGIFGFRSFSDAVEEMGLLDALSCISGNLSAQLINVFLVYDGEEILIGNQYPYTFKILEAYDREASIYQLEKVDMKEQTFHSQYIESLDRKITVLPCVGRWLIGQSITPA